MTERVNELHERRGRLLERIATQRGALRSDLQPVVVSLAAVDRLLARARAGSDYVRQHPHVMALSVAALLAVRPKRAWRWAKRGLFAWQTWRTLSRRFYAFGRNTAR